MIILGIDPGIAIMGFGVIEVQKNKTRVLDYGVIKTSSKDTLPNRIAKIYESVSVLIDRFNPTHFAIEELFFNKNISSAFPVAHGRSAAILAGIHGNCQMYEYTPLQIKQALTGNGRAEKHQVQYMVKAILNLREIPKPDDAADALAIALCHSQTNLLLSNTDIK